MAAGRRLVLYLPVFPVYFGDKNNKRADGKKREKGGMDATYTDGLGAGVESTASSFPLLLPSFPLAARNEPFLPSYRLKRLKEPCFYTQ